MASIHKRKTAKGFVHDVRYRDPKGKNRSETWRRKVDAQRAAATHEADIVRGDWLDPTSGDATFTAWWDEWWETTVSLRPSSRARDESYTRNHVLPVWGDVKLKDIDYMSVREWISDVVDKDLAPSTVQKIHQCLAKPLRAAVTAGKLRANPAAEVELPKVEVVEMMFLTLDRVDDLADAFDVRYRAWPTVASYTGLRAGELLALQWRRVDLKACQLEVAETTTEVRGQVITGPPKTKAARRIVEFPQIVVDALEDHRDTHATDPTGLVFASPQGQVARLGQFRARQFRPAAIKAGLGKLVEEDGQKRYRGLRPHDLRHTAVALWIAAGADPKLVAERAGHTSVSVVLDRYGHLLPGRAKTVNDALDAMAAKARSDRS